MSISVSRSWLSDFFLFKPIFDIKVWLLSTFNALCLHTVTILIYVYFFFFSIYLREIWLDSAVLQRKFKNFDDSEMDG